MHKLLTTYQESVSSWVVQCACGWKEKGISEKSVIDRLKRHVENDVRSR